MIKHAYWSGVTAALIKLGVDLSSLQPLGWEENVETAHPAAKKVDDGDFVKKILGTDALNAPVPAPQNTIQPGELG